MKHVAGGWPRPVTWELVDPTRRSWSDPSAARPVTAYVWDPPETGRGPAPLIVASHGDGSAGLDLAWSAPALLYAGFRVATVDHHGNNWREGYLQEGFTRMWERPRDLTLLIDTVEAEHGAPWVGVFGFSAGGYTAAALLGARLDPAVMRAIHDGSVQVPDPPEYPGLFDEFRSSTATTQLDSLLFEAARDRTDPRVAAAVLLCPGAGRLLDEASLRQITVPVTVVVAPADTITTEAEIRDTYARHIASARVVSAGEGSSHDTFIVGNSGHDDVRARVAAEVADQFICESGRAGSASLAGDSDPR